MWAPPTQCNVNTISAAPSSISATASWMRVRTIRFFSRASVVGADQTAWKPLASTSRETGGKTPKERRRHARRFASRRRPPG